MSRSPANRDLLLGLTDGLLEDQDCGPKPHWPRDPTRARGCLFLGIPRRFDAMRPRKDPIDMSHRTYDLVLFVFGTVVAASLNSL